MIFIIVIQDIPVPMSIDYLRSFKLDGMAIFDFAVTFLFGEILNRYLNLPRSVLYSILVLLAIFIHYIIGQETGLNTKLFNDNNIFYTLLVILMIIHVVLYFI